MRKTVIKILLLTTIVALTQPLFAQSKYNNASDDNDGDQVAEMLDSLVNIRYLSRFNNIKKATKSTFQPNEVPIYPDEVIKQRLAKLQSPIPFEYNSQVKKYIDLYCNRRRELAGMTLGLSKLYFPLFEQILDLYNLPIELKNLAIVESALNPMAVSRVGATGLWQFMYGTGKMYNLEINSYIDERRDVFKSTVAACQYFKEMYAIYHDWLLVIASYNCGPGNVNKAIVRSGGKRNFWEISKYLPKETRGYVPAFIAVNYMMSYATEHNIATIPSAISYFELDTLNITKKLSINQVAATCGLSVDLLRFLNPIYKKNYIPVAEDKPFKLILPSSKVPTFITNADAIYNGTIPEGHQPYNPAEQFAYSNPLVGKAAVITNVSNTSCNSAPLKKVEVEVEIVKDIRKVHIVRKGESLADLAEKYDCTIKELKKWNHSLGSSVRNGQRIIVYLPSDQEKIITKNAPEAESQSSVTTKGRVKYIYHVVQLGDTLWNIAQRYNGVTVAQLKHINRISGNKDLKPGKKIKVVLNV